MNTGGPDVRALALALAVVAVWGTNFAVIRIALDHLPPLLLATLRFAVAALPAGLLLPRPAVPWRELAAYGILIGVGQFGLLFVAMDGMISPGLASLVVQCQAFFTIGLAIWVAGERPLAVQWAALLLAAAGIALIMLLGGAAATPAGLALVLAAAAAWAAGNTIQRRRAGVNMLAYVVWASLFAVPPLLALSLIVEGPSAIANGIAHADAATWAAVAWQAVGNTMFGYGVWGWLLGRYPAATIAPLSLLVPIFGIGASAIWLGEPLPSWKLAAAGLVLLGLAANSLGPRIVLRWRGPQPS